jgi:hypothetical protein
VAEFVASGRLVELAMALTLLEIAVLLVRRRATGRGPVARDYLPNALSGLCLMVALRAALGDAGWTWIAAPLAAAGLAHAADMWLRIAASDRPQG